MRLPPPLPLDAGDNLRSLYRMYNQADCDGSLELRGVRVEVFLTDQNVKFTFPDGKTEEITAKAGETNWAPGVKQHLPENIGDKPLELILVEMKVKSQTTE